MKQKISTPAVIAIFVGAALVIGLIGWKTFGSSSASLSQDETRARQAAKDQREGDK